MSWPPATLPGFRKTELKFEHVCISIYLSMYLCIYLCIYLSVCLSIYVYEYIHIKVIIYINPYNKNCTIYTSVIFPGMQSQLGLRSSTTNKASGGDRIPVELFQILKDGAIKVLHSICQQTWKTQQWPQD